LKSLNNSRDITTNFLREIAYHKLFDYENSQVINCYGISRDPQGNYVMVMQYIKDGNLRQYLQVNYKRLDFKDRLDQLHNIARGLKSIHSKGLVHRDFHAGNILNEDAYCSITDLGLCKPANETSESEIYGVLPYVAPEVLNGKQYTSATDIYSFAMIMYEIFTGLPPYHDIAHEEALAV
jgi:serine/threonine protein kinase